MTEQEKQKPKSKLADLRRLFIVRGWEILTKYLERIDDEELISQTDARSGASVVKTLFDAVDKAEAGGIAEDEIELPEIPESLLDELVARLMGQENGARATRTRRRADKPAVPDRASAEAQA